MKTLTDKQREFLEYVRDNHHSMGWGYTMDMILKQGEYEVGSEDYNPMVIVKDFKELLKGYNTDAYHKPIKYLKG